MSDLLAAVTAPANVNCAWRHLRRDRAPWSPTVDREALGHNLPLYLLELTESIVTQRYRPLSVRQYAIAKPSGGQRVLSLYFLRDKLAQRMVQQILEPLLEPQFHPDSFGYRPRRGVASALARVRERHATGLVWGVHADIESFFDRVPQLDRLSLRLHPDKTEVGRLSPKMRFLGEPVVRRRRWRKC